MGPWVIDQSHSISVALFEEARVPSSMGKAPTEGKLMSIATKNALRVLVTALSFDDCRDTVRVLAHKASLKPALPT